MIVSFTGHRPDKLPNKQIGYKPNPIKDYISVELENILKELKPDRCISGMALGFDQMAALVCIKLDIPFEAAIPFLGQEKRWPFESQNEYNSILDKAVKKTIVCEGGYSAQKMQIRNEYMVDNSDIVVCCFIPETTSGGTYNCVQYAKKLKKQLYFINPNMYQTIKND